MKKIKSRKPKFEYYKLFNSKGAQIGKIHILRIFPEDKDYPRIYLCGTGTLFTSTYPDEKVTVNQHTKFCKRCLKIKEGLIEKKRKTKKK